MTWKFNVKGQKLSCAAGEDNCSTAQFKNKCPVKCDACPQKKKCMLKAEYAYPYADPDDSPKMGYSADWLGIQKGNNYNKFTWCDSSTQPGWCKYDNSNATGTSAYIGNVDDEYYPDWAAVDDVMHNETMTIKVAEGNLFHFCGHHHYNDKDYYPEVTDDWWDDHVLAAVLKINVHNNGVVSSLKDEGWTRKTDKDTNTHLANDAINPDYLGYFCVNVTCSDDCNCRAGSQVYYAHSEESENGFWE